MVHGFIFVFYNGRYDGYMINMCISILCVRSLERSSPITLIFNASFPERMINDVHTHADIQFLAPFLTLSYLKQNAISYEMNQPSVIQAPQ